MKRVIKIALFVPSFWLGLWVGARVPPLFIHGLVGLQWMTITGIALLPIIFVGNKIAKNILWYTAVTSMFIILHTSIGYHEQQNIPLQKGMTREQVRNIMGKSQETLPKGSYARVPGVSFASFRISNVCEIFPYEDGVLYVYINNHGRVEHIFKGKT